MLRPDAALHRPGAVQGQAARPLVLPRQRCREPAVFHLLLLPGHDAHEPLRRRDTALHRAGDRHALLRAALQRAADGDEDSRRSAGLPRLRAGVRARLREHDALHRGHTLRPRRGLRLRDVQHLRALRPRARLLEQHDKLLLLPARRRGRGAHLGRGRRVRDRRGLRREHRPRARHRRRPVICPTCSTPTASPASRPAGPPSWPPSSPSWRRWSAR